MAWDFDDWGSWGIGDMRNGEDELRKAIESGECFDTGWHGWKKEIQSMRIQRTEENFVIECYMEMDSALEQWDLFSDFLTDEEQERLTDEKVDEIREYLYEGEYVEEITYDDRLPVTATYEEIMRKAEELMQDCDDRLTDSFHECIGDTLWVLYPDMPENEKIDMISDRIEEVNA